MKVAFVSSLALAMATGASAFAPSQSASFVAKSAATNKRSFPVRLAKKEDEMTLEEETMKLLEEEKSKAKRMSNLRNERGVEYAPWMNISAEDEVKIKGIMKERAAARRRREMEEQNTKGALLKDSTNQELSGTGLRGKVVDGNNVELEWATGKETSTKGFMIKRRAAKTESFEVLASYEDYGPLASKGVEGGIYRYMDENVSPGGWVYRVTECEANGEENDLSQCLVEIQTEEDMRAQTIAIGVMGVLAIAGIVGASLLDPLQ